MSDYGKLAEVANKDYIAIFGYKCLVQDIEIEEDTRESKSFKLKAYWIRDKEYEADRDADLRSKGIPLRSKGIPLRSK